VAAAAVSSCCAASGAAAAQLGSSARAPREPELAPALTMGPDMRCRLGLLLLVPPSPACACQHSSIQEQASTVIIRSMLTIVAERVGQHRVHCC
jgi:hypothetical protein